MQSFILLIIKKKIALLNQYINKLAVNNEFKYIEEIIYIKTDILRNSLNTHHKSLLN